MWYMRGSMTMDEAFQMGPEDRKLIADLIKENLETAKKTYDVFHDLDQLKRKLISWEKNLK